MLLAALVIAFGSAGCDGGGRRGITPGTRAPNIIGSTLTGEPFALDDIQAKFLVVNFWASWCAPCLAEMPELERLHQSIKEHGGTVVGVAVDDTPGNIAGIVAQYGITFPVLLDGQGSSKRLYEIKGLPETYVLDQEHRVVVIADPEGSAPVTRIVGPRRWSEAPVIKQLLSIQGRAQLP
jgi:thiol-disulfide isomerase/thioredoxin